MSLIKKKIKKDYLAVLNNTINIFLCVITHIKTTITAYSGELYIDMI